MGMINTNFRLVAFLEGRGVISPEDIWGASIVFIKFYLLGRYTVFIVFSEILVWLKYLQ